MYKISVIIPVYNVEYYLVSCLDSVINQSYTNLEIILVNDGSTDSCSQICDKYVSLDKRITVIHQKNKGLSGARNSGLGIATGDYISFVDSDDRLAVNFYEKLLQALHEQNSDVAECDFKKFKTESDIINYPSILSYRIENYNTEKALELLMEEHIKQMVWNKLYRKEVIGDLVFPEGKINEDEYWTYKVIGNTKKFTKMNDILYYYRQQNGSIMGKAYNLKRLDGLDALQERIAYMSEKYPKLKNLAIKKYCLGVIYHYGMLSSLSEKNIKNTYKNKLYKSVKSYNRYSIYKYWKFKEIIYYLWFLISPLMVFKYIEYRSSSSQKI